MIVGLLMAVFVVNYNLDILNLAIMLTFDIHPLILMIHVSLCQPDSMIPCGFACFHSMNLRILFNKIFALNSAYLLLVASLHIMKAKHYI